MNPEIDKETEKTDNNKKMSFKILSSFGQTRHGLLKLPHGNVQTPVFMPVGTQGLYNFFKL